MDHFELILLGLLVAVAGLTALARIIDVPYPILLVVGGGLLGFIPGLPEVELDPDLVLLVFLPPLLFNAAYFASLHELRRDTRTIVLSSVALVLLTAAIVAVVAHSAIDGLSWGAAFALGAIVSPTDPLAATAIAQRLGVPPRLVAMIEGEALINDGSALVVYRTAVAAAVGGSFELLDAGWDFLVNVTGGIAIGLVAGVVLRRAFRLVQQDPLIGVTLSLVSGYLGYIPAEEVGVSGVLAAVTVGLVLGRHSTEISTASARISAYSFWEILVFLLNATLFILVGFQLRAIIDAQERSAGTLVLLGLAISGAVIGSRLLWLNTIPFVIRTLDRRPQQRARRIGWRGRLVTGWMGLRGAVSLAAALALPRDFPERDLIVFLTVCAIFATLVFQGLTLPWLIRRLGIHDDGTRAAEELTARTAATAAAIARMQELRDADWTRDGTVDWMISRYDFRRRRLAQRAGTLAPEDDTGEDLEARSRSYQRLVREGLEAERGAIVALRDDGTISDAVMYRLEREIDLEDERLEF
jgi:CPA1 family monovalent cation:H+ antiporter